MVHMLSCQDCSPAMHCPDPLTEYRSDYGTRKTEPIPRYIRAVYKDRFPKVRLKVCQNGSYTKELRSWKLNPVAFLYAIACELPFEVRGQEWDESLSGHRIIMSFISIQRDVATCMCTCGLGLHGDYQTLHDENSHRRMTVINVVLLRCK